MKKMLFMALAAAGMLSACSNNDDIAGVNANIDESAKQQIQLGVSSATVNTRGTGTVGDMENSADNVWAGQYLWVYMLEKGSMKVAQYYDPATAGAVPTGADIFNNTLFTAPKPAAGATGVATGVASTFDGTIAYYPVTGNSDFWGYRVDDAANADPTTAPTVNLCDNNNNVATGEAATRRVVDITIDGSQDIMAGKAELDPNTLPEGARHEDYFSAYSARKGVQPNIKFNHLLSRLTFNVKAGDESAAGNGDNTEAVKINKVTVKSKVNGKLVVAHTAADVPAQLLTFTDADASTALKLMERPSNDHNAKLKELTQTPLTWGATGGDKIRLGEALLVAPGETSYEMTIELEQNVMVKAGDPTAGVAPVYEVKKLQFTHPIKIDGTTAFEAGNSYDVTVTVYGLQKIEVTATLTPWKDGGNIDIDDDRDPSSSFTPGA